MKNKLIILWRIPLFAIFLLLFIFPTIICAQSALDTIDSGAQGTEEMAPELVTEKIKKISASRRIFILTNNNTSYTKGDFVSLLLSSDLVVRCVVAKNVEKEAGLKIIKIYNVDLWNKLKSGQEVLVLKGDDGYYKNKKGALAKDAGVPSKIDSDEDLFNETRLDVDDQNLEENNNRHIKTDNVVSITYGQIDGVNNDGSAQKYGQPGVQWAYQVTDNFWGEFSYGENMIKDFPSEGLDTKLSNFIFKVKYTIAAPFYSYFKPYIGYQMINASSPGAGMGSNVTSVKAKEETDLVSSLKKNSIVGGFTVLKRLVPGWFVRLDLGTDIMAFGFGLEF